MARYAATTGKSPDDVTELVTEYFGDELGLSLESEDGGPLRFEGGGGHVEIALTPREDGTQLDIETLEWDRQVRLFLERL